MAYKNEKQFSNIENIMHKTLKLHTDVTDRKNGRKLNNLIYLKNQYKTLITASYVKKHLLQIPVAGIQYTGI